MPLEESIMQDYRKIVVKPIGWIETVWTFGVFTFPCQKELTEEDINRMEEAYQRMLEDMFKPPFIKTEPAPQEGVYVLWPVQ